MEIAAAIAEFFGFLRLIFGYVFERWKAARAKEEQLEINRRLVLEAVEHAVQVMRKNLIEDSKDSDAVDDKLDEARKKSMEAPK